MSKIPSCHSGEIPGGSRRNWIQEFFPERDLRPEGSYFDKLSTCLGNTRVVFGDYDGDQRINPDPSASDLRQVLEGYYPFGLAFNGFQNTAFHPENQYLYNGKEKQDELGLGWYDYGARMYDGSVVRWNGVDALADEPEQIDKSPYQYAWNNPIYYTDPDGRCPRCLKALGKSIVKSIAKGKIDLGEVYDIVDNGATLLSPSSTLLERGEALFNLASPVSTKELKAAKNFVEGAVDSKKVYRALSKTDAKDLENGKDLVARSPDAGNTPISHVAGKKESQWISTTKDKGTATGKYNGGNGVIEIDLNKVDSESVDLSGGIPNGGRFSNYAKKDQEVLIKNTVPNSAIKKIE